MRDRYAMWVSRRRCTIWGTVKKSLKITWAYVHGDDAAADDDGNE